MANQINCSVVFTLFNVTFLGKWDECGERPFLWPLTSFPDRHTYSVHSGYLEGSVFFIVNLFAVYFQHLLIATVCICIHCVNVTSMLQQLVKQSLTSIASSVAG